MGRLLFTYSYSLTQWNKADCVFFTQVVGFLINLGLFMLSLMLMLLSRCLTSTETRRLVRDGAKCSCKKTKGVIILFGQG